MPEYLLPDVPFPTNARPYRAMFYLQPYNSRSQSPWTRAVKTLSLSKPLWVARVTFRTGYDGYEGADAWGGEMDAWIAEQEGGAKTTELWDFRRPYPPGLRRYYSQFSGARYPFANGEEFSMGERFVVPAESEPRNEPAKRGATEMAFEGFLPNEPVFLPGDMIGGDGRPHIILRPAFADGNGRAVVRFIPPLDFDVPAGSAITVQPPGRYQLVSDDAGANETSVGELTEYSLDFVEVPR